MGKEEMIREWVDTRGLPIRRSAVLPNSDWASCNLFPSLPIEKRKGLKYTRADAEIGSTAQLRLGIL